MPTRVEFVVDGFNLYHSTREVATRFSVGTKWLDFRSLASARLGSLCTSAVLTRVSYFSAYATHLQAQRPNVIQTHQVYVRALEDSGVAVEMGAFKKRDRRCGALCRLLFTGHEEKYTDVAISVRILEAFHTDACDMVVLVTGDTDVIPAIKAARRMFPGKLVGCLFPFNRKNKELAQHADRHSRLRKEHYVDNQFSDPLVLTDGAVLRKPADW